MFFLRKEGICFWPAVLLSIAMGVMLFLFAPLEIYFNNVNEFWFDLYDFFPICLTMFGVFICISILVMFILFKMNKNVYRVFVVCYMTVFLGTYVQGNFLVKELPPLDGSPIDWSYYSTQRISSIVLWFLAGLIIIFAVKKFTINRVVTFAGVVAGFFSLMFTISIVMIGCIWNGFQDKLSFNIFFKS